MFVVVNFTYQAGGRFPTESVLRANDMGVTRPTKNATKNHPIHGKVVAVSTKDNFRRPVPKTYSYRYEVTGDAGPAGDPLVRAGAAIIEGRYRGRGATWNVARSVVEPDTYLVKAGYIHPLEENPMAYPPRAVVNPEIVAAAAQRTPGFPSAPAANKAVRPRPQMEPPATTRYESPAPPPSAIRRPGARPTPANESAYKKTG
jgi:hypothetical protein